MTDFIPVQSPADGSVEAAFHRLGRRFRPDRAGSTRAVIHWRLRDEDGPGGYQRYEMVIEHGRLTIRPGRSRDAHAVVTVNRPDFLALVDDRAHGPSLFTDGRLQASGEMAALAALPELFGAPAQALAG
jgi:alkyl sulfatase BDS1-like metallo-beta-lactamase superfamily hydrolase